MQRIPYTYVKKFSESLETVTEQAKVKLRAALMGVDMSDPEAARAQIADIMEMIVGASDAMASSMAAGFYDGIREFQLGERLGAFADSGRDPDSTKNATYGITHRLTTAENPDISLVEGLLTQRIGYEIKRSAGNTMYRNGQRDPNKPKFARIPVGGDSCEFCRMLASRGFAYNSEKSAGKHDSDHYHDGCRCEVVSSWEKDPRIAGMTEEEYNARAWGEHRDAARSYAGKDHSQHQANQAAKRRNRYTSDGRLAAGYSGERIDKQKVYTAEDRKRVAAKAAAQRGTKRSRNVLGLSKGGSASPNMVKLGQVVDRSNPEETATCLARFEEEIRAESSEHAYAILRNGEVWHAVGDGVSVSLGELELDGAIVTHNHPLQYGESLSFGKDDYAVLQTNPEIDVLRAVNPLHNYEASVVKPLDKTYNDAYREYLDFFSDEEVQHQVMEGLKNDGYIRYSRSPV